MHILKNRFEVIRQLRDPLLKNSLFIMITSLLSSGFGFIFWMLAAKFYSAEDVGVATAIISSMSLLVLFSKFGLDFSIIRFFPVYDKARIFNTSIIITTFFAVIFGIIFITGIDIFSPELKIIQSPSNSVLYLLFLAASSIFSLTGISFIAIRKAGFQFLQSIVVGSRIFFLFPLITFGAFGIFNAVGISLLIASFISLIFLMRSGIMPAFTIDRKFLNDAFHFSTANYFSDLFMLAPNMILPIMVLNILCAEQAAYYYVTFMIASLLFLIPGAISMSLFVEGSHGEELKKTIIKSLIVIFLLLIPAVGLLYIGSEYILGVVGERYADEGVDLLQVMVVTSLFVGMNNIYFSIKRIQKDVKSIVVLSGVIGGLVIGLGYVFMVMFGVVGVGYAWLVGNVIGCVIVSGMVWREGWLS